MRSLVFLTALLGVLNPLAAWATTTLHFNDAYATGLPDNLANDVGVVSNGMRWGVIISTTDAAFAGGGTNYDEYAAGSNTAGFLSVGGVLTDDYFIPGTLTQNAAFLAGGDGGATAGDGSILDDLTLTYTNGISLNDKFGLVWFGSAGNTSTAGSKYGFFEDASFVLPGDGLDPIYGAAFQGTDPIRSASNTFASLAPVPEPSRLLLLGFGAFGLMLRRRRQA